VAKKEKLLEAAQKSLQKNQLSKAIRQYEKILELDDKDFRCRQKLAELYSRKGEVDKALTHYEKVATYYSDHAFYLKAIAVYKQMQRLAPENASFTLKLAKLNEQQGLTGNALTEYRTLLQSYEAESNLRGAIETLGRIRHLDSDNANAAVKQADYLARSGQKEESQRIFNEVEDRLRQKGNYKHLELFYQHFMELWPDNVEVMVGYGRAMLEFGAPEAAVAYLDDLYQRYPENGAILDHLTAGLHQCSEFKREIVCLHKWVEIEPENLDSRLRLYDALLQVGENETCFAALEEAKQRFFAAERVAGIKPFYERLRELLPAKPDVMKSLRAIYEHLGEGEKLFNAFSAGDESAFGVDALASPSAPAKETVRSDSGASETPEATSAAEEEQNDADFESLDFDDIVFDTVDEDQEPLDFDTVGIQAADATPSTGKSGADLKAVLEEIDFYMQQGLLDEALEGCQRLNAQVPDNPEVKQRLEKIERFRARQSASKAEIAPNVAPPHQSASQNTDKHPRSSSSTEESLLGLSQSLQDEFSLDVDIPELADSQLGIETEIEDEDTESAYNLGIAYMEMGLYSDAGLQFNKAKRDPAHKVASISMQAQCYRAMQQYEKAEEILTSVLSAVDLSMDERIVLYYETGLLYEECDRHADALASYQVVAEKNPEFREARKKVSELKQMLKTTGNNDDLSRVSYV